MSARSRQATSVLMVTASEMATDARVCREAETLSDAGYAVRIVCLASSIPAQIRNVELIEYDLRWLPRRARLAATAVVVSVAVLLRRADIYHAHNVPVLPACWLAARLHRRQLVYDAHEVFVLVSRFPSGAGGRHTRRHKVEAAIDRWFGPRADLRLTASDGYAAATAQGLGVEAPLVIPNYPPLPPLITDSPLRTIAGAGPDDIVILYQGGFYLTLRPLDVVVRGMALLPPRYRLVLLGFGATGEDQLLTQIAKDEGVQDRVTIRPAVPHQELARYTSGADIGLIPLRLLENTTYLSAPNKLYEYFQASVAVLSAATEELTAVMEATQAGRVYRSDSAQDFADQVRALASDRRQLAAIGRCGREAAEKQYSWQAVSHRLVEAYQTLGVSV